jgi:hypothetical protein
MISGSVEATAFDRGGVAGRPMKFSGRSIRQTLERIDPDFFGLPSWFREIPSWFLKNILPAVLASGVVSLVVGWGWKGWWLLTLIILVIGLRIKSIRR